MHSVFSVMELQILLSSGEGNGPTGPVTVNLQDIKT